MLFFLTDRRRTKGELPFMAIQPFAAFMPHINGDPQAAVIPGCGLLEKTTFTVRLQKTERLLTAVRPAPDAQSPSQHAAPTL